MYLLILANICLLHTNNKFTSHYVSINSPVCTRRNSGWRNLHPTMYLLILSKASIALQISLFTSHYVSINSISRCCKFSLSSNLHPTMYLLILRWKLFLMKMQKYLHPTMYLLILVIIPSSVNIIKFTSHYVSINSHGLINPSQAYQHLHPTMYLLIQSSRHNLHY